MRERKICLKELEKPRIPDLKDDISWICESFSLGSGRDTEEIARQVVTDLIICLARERAVPAERIASDLGISQARVNHHIRNLRQSGIVMRKRGQVSLRRGSMLSTVREMRKDADRIFDEIEAVAVAVDEAAGLISRSDRTGRL